MAVTIGALAEGLAAAGIRHHVDGEQQMIRVVFVTRHYVNPRGERLAILQLEPTDGGNTCRVSLPGAFAAGPDRAARCLALCEALADVPLARIGPDAAAISLVAETPVEDGGLTPRQIFAMLDAIVEAAEAGQRAVDSLGDGDGHDAAAREAA